MFKFSEKFSNFEQISRKFCGNLEQNGRRKFCRNLMQNLLKYREKF